MLQRQPLQILHDDERLTILSPDFVDRADIRMIQCRSCFRFSLKSSQRLRLFGYIIRQELERDKAVQAEVFSLVDHTHPAATELFDDAVMRDGLANHWAEILGPGLRQVNEGVEFGGVPERQL